MSICANRSKPTAEMLPDCSAPSSEPAPRISRSRIAILMPRPELVVLLDGAEPLDGLLGERALAREQEVRERLHVAAPDPAFELVELRETEALGVLDDERVAVRVVDARLDDRGGDEHVGLVGGEALHHRLELLLRHLPVRDHDARLGCRALHPLDRVVDRLHAVGDVVDLAAALELSPDGARDDVLVPLAHVHRDREAVGRRSVDDRHVAHAGKRHLQRARDRRRREREDVDLLAEVLQMLLVLDAEALLLVDDDEPEVLRRDVAREQAVRAHEHVDLTAGEALKRGLLLRVRCGSARAPRRSPRRARSAPRSS